MTDGATEHDVLTPLCGVVPGSMEAVVLGCICSTSERTTDHRSDARLPRSSVKYYRLLARCPVHGKGVRERHRKSVMEIARRRRQESHEQE